MTNDKIKEEFEKFVREANQLEGPYLRACNDVDPEYTYQDPVTELLWWKWKSMKVSEFAAGYYKAITKGV